MAHIPPPPPSHLFHALFAVSALASAIHHPECARQHRRAFHDHPSQHTGGGGEQRTQQGQFPVGRRLGGEGQPVGRTHDAVQARQLGPLAGRQGGRG